MKKRKCSWRKARERTTMDRHGPHQITPLVLGHKDDNEKIEPSASVVRCALVNILDYTNVSCEKVSCLEKRSTNAHIHQDSRVPVTRNQ